MKKKDAVLRLWRECFDDSDQYVDMFFSAVYRDDDALLLEHDGQAVSSMLLQRYAMKIHGVTASISYVCGAATTRRYRDRGYMAQLMREALRVSYGRGDMLSTLIPANDPLYGFYGKFCFSPVFYINLERYTSAHTFRNEGVYERYYSLDSADAYAFFAEMSAQRPCSVQHTREQYDLVLMENSADAGTVIALADGAGLPVAMAFVTPSDGEATVRELLARDEDSREAVLEEVHREFAGMPVTVYGYIDRSDGELRRRGMARIVDAAQCLEAVAEASPSTSLALRVCDPVIGENNHIYIVNNGSCLIDDGYTGALDYDIDIEVLTSIIFGNDVTRRLLGLPAVRPFISLMLD